MRVILFALCATLSAQRVPAEKEIAMGRVLAADFHRNTPPVDSPLIQDYVAGLGARLTAQLPDRGVPYTFSVVQGWLTDEPHVLPGGYVFVPLHLFNTADDEAEFAAMLAQAAVRAAFLMDDSGSPYLTTVAGSQVMIPVSMVPRLRALGFKADAASVPVLVAAGFDPHALLRYIENLPPVKVSLFSIQQPREERIAALREVLRMAPQSVNASSDTFTAIQLQVRADPVRDQRPTLRREASPLQLR